METIGLIAAIPQESAALLRILQGYRRVAVGPLKGQSFELGGQTCVLVTSGMGVRRAGEATRLLVEQCTPRTLISFGIAGAVEAGLNIGDGVTAEAVCRLERGEPGPLLPLATWPEPAWAAAEQALASRGARLFSGTAVTTSKSQVFGSPIENLPHPILEMETAAIAQVAAEKGIPCLSLRAISDGPCAPIPFNLGEVMDDDANLQGGKLLKALVRNPRILIQSLPMIRNSRIAADYAAIALVAAISTGSFPAALPPAQSPDRPGRESSW